MELIVNIFIITVVVIVLGLFLAKKNKSNAKYKINGEKIKNKFFETMNEYRKFNDNEKNKIVSSKITLLSNEIIAFKIVSEKNLDKSNQEQMKFKEEMFDFLYNDLIVFYLIKCKITDGINYTEKDFKQFKKRKYFNQVKNMLEDRLINIGLSKIDVYNELRASGKAKNANETTKRFYASVNKQIEKQKTEINKKFNQN